MHALSRIGALCLLCAIAGRAAADPFGSPSISRMTAAYDPGAQAVMLGDEPDYRIFDPQVQQAGVYQPPGRVYGVQDPYSVSGPGVVASPAPMATLGQPMLVQPSQSFGACGPVDPYACQPCYPQPLAQPTPIAGLSALRPAHVEIEGRAGDPAETLQGNLMVPFWQQPDVHWFFDIRGQYDDNRAGEGNFGVARRERLPSGLIVGVYTFYDLRHSQFNNNFQQGMLGFEMLTLDWEYRVNGYLPFTGTQATGVNSASVQNGNIVVQQGLERAYFGWDAEFGWLMWRLGGTYEHEVRAFAGGYYFDTDKAGFPSIGGVRARLEGRLYDLPILGAGSRFTYGASYQWDDVRDNQWLASVNLRIPFGAGGRAYTKLSPIDRRMLSAIRRDEAIVTGRALGAAEQAIISSNGIVATNVTEADTAAEITGGGPIVVMTGNVNTAATISLNDNQFVGGQFEVEGQNSGAKATFGRKHTINGTNAASNVVQIANNSTLTGLNITGGKHGVYGGGNDNNNFGDDAGVSGFTISNNTVSNSGVNGINLDGEVNGGIIDNNIIHGAAVNGVLINELASGTISGNTVYQNTVRGFQFRDAVTGGSITGNEASNNQGAGFLFAGVSGVNFSGNSATGNAQEGFHFGSQVSGGVISNNLASGNQSVGFYFANGLADGTFTGNTAIDNASDGISFTTVTAGEIRGNHSDSNGGDGFNIQNLNGAGAVVANNNATDNTGDGFEVVAFPAGDFLDNRAFTNGGMGFNFPGAFAGNAAGNGGSGNTGGGNQP